MANVVLVHGLFADGSSYRRVIHLLLKARHNVVAAQLGRTGLVEDTATVRRLLDAQDGPTVLVGHSYGGAVITEAAAGAANAAALVYLAALAPDEGEDPGTLLAKFPTASGFGEIKPRDGGTHFWIEPASFHKVFAADVDREEAEIMAVVQGPASAACFAGRTGTPAWRSLPSWYLISENDRIVNPDLQRWMAERIGAKVVSIESSHASPVSRPHDVAELIGAAAASIT
jgi:pimeloyl-ACP methyl ester carboxylesterase